MDLSDFPIQPLLPEVLAALERHPRLVLEAPPGAGKTTQVPLALLQAGWRGDGRILMLEPRRVAARAAAGFMARQRGEAVGATVGYRIRFENKVSAATRIEVLTEGILTRMIQDDPTLDSVAAIVFDEFHERHLAGDLGLALALDVQAQLRPDLRLLVMSATLDGAALAREPRFDPNSGFSRLQTTTISQASADQRAGRAGRVAPGTCYRLWPQSQRLEPMRTAEIHQVELAALALELAAWGSSELCFLDPPPAGPMAAAQELLQRLGALDADQRITALGRRMLALGTHPRLSAMLLGAPEGTPQALACDLAALVEARDPLRGYRGDDWAARWWALAQWRAPRAGRGARSVEPAVSGAGEANRGALAAIDAASSHWRRRLRCTATPPAQVPAHALGDRLVHAFPERIGYQHATDPRRYQLAGGRMARLADDSALFGEPWIVASELRFEARDSLVLRGAPVDEAQLRRDFPQRFLERDIAHWDPQARALQARRERRFDRIVLDSRPAGGVDPALAAEALAQAVGEWGLEVLPWSEGTRQWRERVRWLRSVEPSLGLPDLSDEALRADRDWLLPALRGATRLDAVDASALGDALRCLLDWPQRQALERLAPTALTVPSGMTRPIAYAHDAEPVLAVKLQELFGLADTPRIVDGRVPLTLHLLSPGGKPLQVTRDLRGFWDRTYPEVRKEMKGRYPRHPWPDDPWTATATHRAKPRGT